MSSELQNIEIIINFSHLKESISCLCGGSRDFELVIFFWVSKLVLDLNKLKNLLIL